MTIEDLDRKIETLDRKIETLDRKIGKKLEDLGKKIDSLGREMSEKLHQITLTMIGMIISIWAVTLITASTLYIVTR